LFTVAFDRISPIGRALILTALMFAGLQGCASTPARYADSVADRGALQEENVASGPFTLTTYSRIQDINAPVTVYIEGDIQGWWPTTEPGVDPMPDDFLGLRLATLDPSPNVVYIARPCQFALADDTSCDPTAWSRGRHAELIVANMNRVVDHFVVPFTHPHVNLVGYSGGGAIAAVIASRRHDVTSLRTIAGNLDPAATSRYHAADLDEDFLDPMGIATRLALIPQEHFVGTGDTVVPPFLVANFVKAIGPSYCVKVENIPGATHKTGWEQIWQSRAASIPVCGIFAD
jgi:pimeloyl-ACP methyl ester carboxylesterase